MKYFFWIAFAVFLAASIPHVAYFFASFEPTAGPEGIWWWVVSYAIAISIDVTVYLLSWTAFQRYRKYHTARAVWQHWVLIVMCTFFSWAVNWAYAKQFHNASMLSAAEASAPWLTYVFPFMASAFPLLGIVYTMMAETITETAAEEKKIKIEQLSLLSGLEKQSHLPVATLQRALTSGSTSLIETHANEELKTLIRENTDENSKEDVQQAITGQVVALESPPEQSVRKTRTTSTLATVPRQSNTGTIAKTTGTTPSTSGTNPDKLQMTIEILKARPDMTDEALAEFLSLKRPASARFWRLKAIEILNNTPEKDLQAVKTPQRSGWTTTGAIANGAKR